MPRFYYFANKAVDIIAKNEVKLVCHAGSRQEEPDEIFRRARRLTTWHCPSG